MTIRTIDEANRALLPFVPLVSELKAKDVTLERVRPLMKLLGNPEDKLQVIHLAGTSGKTSTAYFIAALLQAAGKKTGLTVSPHVDSVAERVQIGGSPLPEAEFCALLGEFLEIVKTAKQPPTYFELLYAFALWVFARQAVDYAVVETGMGGLHDATNVARRDDKVCVITDIGFDHTHILGNSLPEIAAQKAGIIHERNHVFTYRQTPEIMTVIEKRVASRNGVLHLVKEPATKIPGMMAAYQWRNWNLAYETYRYLAERDKLPNLTDQVLRETQGVQVPARMDIVEINGRTLVMDGAHNAQKMKAFVNSFQHLYPGVRPAIVIGLKDGKEYAELIPLLVPLAGRVITTAFHTSQDLPVKSMDPDMLAAAFRSAGLPNVKSITDQALALKSLLAGQEAVCVITGSFYLLSQIRDNQHISQIMLKNS